MMTWQQLTLHPWKFFVGSVLAAVIMAMGAQSLSFQNNYRMFFGEDNPELLAFERLQATYNKEDNVLIAIASPSGSVFTVDTLTAVQTLTEAAWQTPFSSRVDSMTNYQHTYAIEDDLIVEDLVMDANTLTPEDLQRIQSIATTEPRLTNFVVSESGHVTGINIVVQLPEDDPLAVAQVAEHVRTMVANVQQDHPDLSFYLSGVVFLNNAFTEASMQDMMTLIPLMYLVIILVMWLLVRSLWATVGTVIVILLSTITAMGIWGWLGGHLTPTSATAPTVIMTLAVADSIHIIMTMLLRMRQGAGKHEAIIDSIKLNWSAIFLTSLTTAIGFLSMNASDAPPFRDFGNIIAIGVMAAFVFSVVLLPAFLAIVPIKVAVDPDANKQQINHALKLDVVYDWILSRYKPLMWLTLIVSLIIAAGISKTQLNDNFVQYFDESIQFRVDSDFVNQNLTGVQQLFFSVESGEAQGINEPAYLQHLNDFHHWLTDQPEVIHVSTIADIMKRLNKNMHGDDEAYYRVPDDRELAAQYLLLYEMSLPYGLDLNNQINVDKSATKVAITLQDLSTNELLSFTDRAEQWLAEHTPDTMHTQGISTAVMFAHITQRNIESMLSGTAIAIVLIALTLMITLRNVKLGLLSLVPNLLPVLTALGIWAIWKTELGMAGSIVVAITLGIVVDDTVHFLSKYLRARKQHQQSPKASVRYAFDTVGLALTANTLILVIGFAVLALSAFQANAQTGIITAMTIGLALVLDFLILPGLLMGTEKSETTPNT